MGDCRMKVLGWLIPPWFKWAAIALALGGTFYLGWHERGIRCENARLKTNEAQQKAADKQRAEADRASAEYEAGRAPAAEAARARETTVREIYRHVEVPASCEPGPDALSVLDDALGKAGAATGEPGAAVPGATG